MTDQNQLSEKESFDIINKMIQKTKTNYHDRGISSLLWGSVVTIASLVTYAQIQFNFKLGFDIWLLVLAAIIPQIFISIKEKKQIQFKKYDDEAIDAVWIVYALTIFGLVAYQNIVPNATLNIIQSDGWVMMKHYNNGTKPDELLQPFPLSFTSIFILVYAFPTLITGLIKKFKPMIIGGVISYILFIFSCFTETKYDMLFAALAATVNWLIPGIILRRRYLKKETCNV